MDVVMADDASLLVKYQKTCCSGGGSHRPKTQGRKQARRVSLTHYTENLRFHLKVNLPVDQEGLRDVAVTQFQRRGLNPKHSLQGLHPASIDRTDSGISVSAKPRFEKGSKQSLFLPVPRPGCIRNRPDPTDLDGDLVTASVSSECSTYSDDPADSRQHSPLASDYENGSRTAAGSPSSMMANDQSSVTQINSREALKPVNVLFNNQLSPSSPKRRPLSGHVPNLQATYHGAFCSAPDSSISSPSRSPMRAFGTEKVFNSAFWAGKPYTEPPLLGSGHCSSPGSGHNSGHNSMGGDLSGQLFWQPSRGSPEYSPIPSPRMASPGPGSRIHSGAVTPLHPRAGGAATESQTSWTDDGKQQTTSPSVPRSPGRAENPTSPGFRWKKGKLLGRGMFGDVYLGFNRESGDMCAMKVVTLFSDDAKSKESAKQLGQEIALLSRLRHPNIVQYFGSEIVGDELYIYLEYVSGGSIYKLLQEYGQFGESVIRSYTQQILSGLAYLHAKNTVHRDIKGANILVDPNGRIKLADFGMAKHITGQSCPLSFKGSPYWMAPEVIQNSNGCNFTVDIWSLGCTILEMATTKPPWSQYEGAAAMFKIGHSKELPAIPDHLSDDGKDFVRLSRAFRSSCWVYKWSEKLRALDKQEMFRHWIQKDLQSIHLEFQNLVSIPVMSISQGTYHAPSLQLGALFYILGRSGAIPFDHLNQSIFLQEGFGSLPKSPPSNIGPSYHSPNRDIFQRMQSTSHIFQELTSSGNDALGMQFGRPAHGTLYDGQSVLAERVSMLLLRDHVKLNPTLDLHPCSPLPSRTKGT
ncbi:hypothetical protein F0562_031224 [Nyssa sinensis]|uniref:mitogen-activated protein kinase kinase kinase n=1 Tax=Nyssa sinensis TaxID=561372 RepID=A0A5J5AW47_9ASTE|nr:hypothetical protein F0562_031224 [Nyssa sinensis]